MLMFMYFFVLSLGTLAFATPLTQRFQTAALSRRTYPIFPDQPPSCPICAQNYDNINSCAEAAPVLANFSMIIFNPGAFIDVIKCACTDTFQSTFPQCVDCFVQTNQTQWLEPPEDLPSIVDGMRKICAIESTLLGNVSITDGEVTPSSTAPTPTATTSWGVKSFSTSSSAIPRLLFLMIFAGFFTAIF